MTEQTIDNFNINMKIIGCDAFIQSSTRNKFLLGDVNVEELRVPEGMHEIQPRWFGLSKPNYTLKRIYLPDSLLEICGETFDNFVQLEEVIGGTNVEVIDRSAFKTCDELKEVAFPNLRTLGVRAFMQCINLERADLGHVTEIATQAFKRCVKLYSVKADDAINISEGAFEYCYELDEFIGNNIEQVGERAFGYCEALKSVAFTPKKVRASAFEHSGIEKIDFSATRNIENGAFRESKLTGKIQLKDCEIMDEAFKHVKNINVEISGASKWQDNSFDVECTRV